MAMESISLKFVLFADISRNPSYQFHHLRRISCRTRRSRFDVICSKTSEFQDFRNYAKPLRLLQAKEVKVYEGNPSPNESGSHSSYKIKLQTSNTFGSGLSDVNSRVLLCLIDEKGDSILQTIPANVSRNESLKSNNVRNDESLAFQRGSVDEIVFEGPKLDKIRALWVSVESGQWRLGGMSLWVIHPYKASHGETINYRYDFEVDDILLGENSDLSMVELRPSHITKLDKFDLLKDQINSSSSILNANISNEQSMKEYSDLKLSLLLYDAMLVLLGTTTLYFSIDESSGIAFFIGGILGFLHLLLLQRSVDELSVPESSLSDQKLGLRLKIPVLSLAVAVGFVVVAMKGDLGGESVELEWSAKEILVGTVGFVVCKVAVVLAAFKPLSFSLKAKK